jgi:acetyl-CoA carboxylase biotin carboxyl carrier protein
MAYLVFFQKAQRGLGGRVSGVAGPRCAGDYRGRTSLLVPPGMRSRARPHAHSLLMKARRRSLDEVESTRDSVDGAREERSHGGTRATGANDGSGHTRTGESPSLHAASGQPADGVALTHTASPPAAGTHTQGVTADVSAPEQRQPGLSLSEVQEFLEVMREVTLYCSDARLQIGSTVIEVSRPDGFGFDEHGELRTAEPHPSTHPGDSSPASAYSAPAMPPDAESSVLGSSAAQATVSSSTASTSARAAIEQRSGKTPEPRPRYDDVSQILDTDFKVISNRVGIFRAGPPSRPPYVKVGDRIEVKRPVCIIEQLGNYFVYNSEVSGTVIKVCVEDGAPVEYGKELVIIRPE